ncbi:hypothetical protein GCM10009624_07760 [Gordonia sinesedis]
MLSRCIATDAGSFATRHWGRQPLLSRSAELPRDFTDLLSPATVDELIAERGVRAPFIRMARRGDLLARECYLGPAGFGAEMPDQVDSAKVLTEFADGATIVLQGLHRLWPPLIDFVRSMVDDLGHPTQANAYITPPTGRGFDPHYDVHDVFVLQVAGSKRWLVHAPVHAHPLPTQPWTEHRAAIDARVAADPPVIDTTLHAGDALYLPRGWLHSAQAEDTTSIHLTIGVSSMTGLDLARAVVDSLADSADLRASLPMGIDPTDRSTVAAMTTKIMAQVADGLRQRAEVISEDAAARIARRHTEATRPVAVRPLATLSAAQDAESVCVRWRHGLTGDLASDAGHIRLRLPGKTITFPGFCAPALDTLRRGVVSDAGSLPGLDHPDATVLIRRLLREGVVTPAEQPSGEK